MSTGGLIGQNFITEARLNEILKNYATNQTLDSYLAKSGGTMTGDLTLNRAPVSDMQAVNKRYVDEIGSRLKVLRKKDIQKTLAKAESSLTALYSFPLNYKNRPSNLLFMIYGTIDGLYENNLSGGRVSMYIENNSTIQTLLNEGGSWLAVNKSTALMAYYVKTDTSSYKGLGALENFSVNGKTGTVYVKVANGNQSVITTNLTACVYQIDITLS